MAWPTFAQCLLAVLCGNSSLVAFPFQVNYSAIVVPYNLDYPVVPAAVAFPNNAIQVAALVECAILFGHKVQPKSRGHSAANYGSSTGELSINLQNLQNFPMDTTTFQATVGPGVRLGDRDELIYNAGQRFEPHGSSGAVALGGHGVVGGAGFGWRTYGLTIDHIREVEVVLANATIVRASALENPDLFFAMRGAGPSFGIVIEYVLNTLPAPAQTQALADNSSIPWAANSILEVTNNLIFMLGAYFGTFDDFNALGLPSLLPPAQQSSSEVLTNWLTLSQLWAEQIAQSGREAPTFFYIKSAVFRSETRIPDSVVDQVFEYFATTDSGAESWDIEIQAGGGQNGAVTTSATSFPHRDASFVLLSYAATNVSVTATTTSFLDGFQALAESNNPDAYYGEYVGFVDAKEHLDQARYHY